MGLFFSRVFAEHNCFLIQFVEKVTRVQCWPSVSNDPNMVETGEQLGRNGLNVVSTILLLRCEVWDSVVRLLYFRRANFEGIRSDLGELNWVKLGWSASEKWETFKEQMCRMQSRYFPVRCKG